jgi:hypothetical protein
MKPVTASRKYTYTCIYVRAGRNATDSLHLAMLMLHTQHCCLLCMHTCQRLMLAAYAAFQAHSAAHFIQACVREYCSFDELASSQDVERLSLFRDAQTYLMTAEQLYGHGSSRAVAYLVRTKKQADASIVRPVIKLRRPAPVYRQNSMPPPNTAMADPPENAAEICMT